MPPIQQSLEKWKQELTSHGLDADSIEELEAHLEEAIADHCEQGLSEEEAFAAASLQIGSVKSIGVEFRKEESLLVGDWIMLGLCTLIAFTFIGGIIYFTLTGTLPSEKLSDPLLYVHVITLFLGYLGLLGFATIGMYSVLRRLFTKRSEYVWMETFAYVLRWDGLACLTLVTIGLITGSFWSQEYYGKYWSWDPKEIGGLMIWAWYAVAVTCAWLKILRLTLMPALTISGGNLCLIGWIGTAGLPITFVFVSLSSLLLVFLLFALRLYRKPSLAEITMQA